MKWNSNDVRIRFVAFAVSCYYGDGITLSIVATELMQPESWSRAGLLFLVCGRHITRLLQDGSNYQRVTSGIQLRYARPRMSWFIVLLVIYVNFSFHQVNAEHVVCFAKPTPHTLTSRRRRNATPSSERNRRVLATIIQVCTIWPWSLCYHNCVNASVKKNKKNSFIGAFWKNVAITEYVFHSGAVTAVEPQLIRANVQKNVSSYVFIYLYLSKTPCPIKCDFLLFPDSWGETRGRNLGAKRAGAYNPRCEQGGCEPGHRAKMVGANNRGRKWPGLSGRGHSGLFPCYVLIRYQLIIISRNILAESPRHPNFELFC